MKRISQETIDQLVFDLKKPGRYIGHELNQIVKEKPFIRMAISYPDLYEVGMSNNGIRILYDIVNKIEDAACERVFAVENDFEQKARSTGIPLYTLETYTPLHELDILGFNISHELLYTNILQIIDLGGIPVFSKDRGNNHPIIIAGGGAASNPAPMQDFIDAFFIGDGEDGILDILDSVRKSKLESLDRHKTIEQLAEIDGVYVPSQYQYVYDDGRLTGIRGKTVRKKIYRSPEMTGGKLLPNIRITQERMTVEVTRGCGNLCKFCHAGYYELPFRRFDPDVLKDIILNMAENSPYDELTLSSLSIGDYDNLEHLLNMILPGLIRNGISISLPSLKVDMAALPVIENVSDLRRTSLTFAVESACDEIRAKANKRLRIEDLLSITGHVFNSGWKLLKLYFMTGLPGYEEHDEAEAIISLLKQIRKTGGGGIELNVTISPFVPKPHTPFQWEKQADTEYFKSTLNRIIHGVPRSIKIKSHDINASFLEGIFARGDAALGRIIYAAYMDGCRLDSWTEYFKFDVWKKHLESIDRNAYLGRRGDSDILPWSRINTGFGKLININKNKTADFTKVHSRHSTEKLDTEAIKKAMEDFNLKFKVKQMIRLTFSRKGPARFYSHLDFIEIVKRALRMSGIPVTNTQGFNKREKLALGFPLPLGIESESELCDVDLYENISLDDIKAKLNQNLPGGIKLENAASLESRESIMSITSAITYHVETADPDLGNNIKRNLEAGKNFVKESKGKKREILFKDAVLNYVIEDQAGPFTLTLAAGEENAGKAVRIDNAVLDLSESGYDRFYKFRIIKLCQMKNDNGKYTEINYTTHPPGM